MSEHDPHQYGGGVLGTPISGHFPDNRRSADGACEHHSRESGRCRYATHDEQVQKAWAKRAIALRWLLGREDPG
jgi:hypothetical protein